jgi:hypothetical protein
MKTWKGLSHSLKAGVVLGAALLTGCATVTTGSKQSITLLSDPEGATCLMEREGETIGAVSSTPGSVMVGKDKDPIDIACNKPGYLDGSRTVESTFQGATLGNVLIGGVIGIAIDAGSGAMNRYPESVELTLIPESFDSADARDRYFDERVGRLQVRERDALEAFDRRCGHDNRSCPARRQLIVEEFAVLTAELEDLRATAVVAAATGTADATDATEPLPSL